MKSGFLGYTFEERGNMQTIRLRVHNRIYKNLILILKRFSKEEIQIIKEDEEFLSVQDYLKSELKNLENDDADFIDIDQLEQDLENTIKNNEA